jgi:hypothetical protein
MASLAAGTFKSHVLSRAPKSKPEVGLGFPEENRGGSAQLREIQVLLDSASKTMDFLLKFERGIR